MSCFHITDIIASGVASLKIEGRQKPPEYVYGCAKIYRRLIDEGRNATPDEIEALERIFSRDGFSDGYFAKNMKNMRGVRTYDDFLQMDKSKFVGLTKKAPLDIKLTAVSGENAEFEVKTKDRSFSAAGDVVKPAGEVAPLTEEGARKNSGRLGSTPFELSDFTFVTDGNAALTLSEVNALRRRAVEGILSAGREKVEIGDLNVKKAEKPFKEIVYSAEFTSKEQITPLAKEFFSRIYLPYGNDSDEFDISLPPYLPDERAAAVKERVKGKRVLAHTTGQLFWAARECAEAAASLRMNIFNSAAAEYYAALGAKYLILTPEAKRAQLRDISSPVSCGAVVYGRLTLMLTARCAISDGQCKKKDKTVLCRSAVIDRHGTEFPVYGMPDCTNVIYNSVPIYMADKRMELEAAGMERHHFIFTCESAEECDRIIMSYINQSLPKDPARIRRIK